MVIKEELCSSIWCNNKAKTFWPILVLRRLNLKEKRPRQDMILVLTFIFLSWNALVSFKLTKNLGSKKQLKFSQLQSSSELFVFVCVPQTKLAEKFKLIWIWPYRLTHPLIWCLHHLKIIVILQQIDDKSIQKKEKKERKAHLAISKQKVFRNILFIR